MDVLEQGAGELFTDPDPDRAREFFHSKSRKMVKQADAPEGSDRKVRKGRRVPGDRRVRGEQGADRRVPRDSPPGEKEYGLRRPHIHPRFPDPRGRRGLRQMRRGLYNRPRSEGALAGRAQIHAKRQGQGHRMEQLQPRREAQGGHDGRAVRPDEDHHGNGHLHAQRREDRGMPVHGHEGRASTRALSRRLRDPRP